MGKSSQRNCRLNSRASAHYLTGIKYKLKVDFYRTNKVLLDKTRYAVAGYFK